MKYSDYDKVFRRQNNSVYGMKLMPEGYEKIYCYCAKIF